MIPYIELRDRYTLKQKAMLTPIDCFLELTYYGVGEFQLTCNLNKNIKNGDFISLPNKKYLWLITSINPKYDANNGYTMIIRGKQAKYIITYRIIKDIITLSTDLKTAVNNLIYNNAGAGATLSRNMGVVIASSSVNETIIETQATRGDLLEFTENLLKTKECASELFLEDNDIKYRVYKGEDKSGYVKFSQSFDNLLNSDYLEENLNAKNSMTIEGEGVVISIGKRGVRFLQPIDRKEIYYESGVATKYTDASGNEVELDLTNASDLDKYKQLLGEAGEDQFTQYQKTTKFNGEIDTHLNQYVFDEDYYLGDKVEIRDDNLGISATPRVLKMTFSQNVNGYGENIEVGEE